jgi:hypothetical protein
VFILWWVNIGSFFLMPYFVGKTIFFVRVYRSVFFEKKINATGGIL